jgi:hypothetical protein
MTSRCLAHHEQAFRSAVEAQNFSLAQTALQRYVACFQARNRTLAEVEDARTLLQWAVNSAQTYKAQLAEDLMRLQRVSDAYALPRRPPTWRIEG